MITPILVIDVAHPPRGADEVESELLEAWSRVRNASDLKIVKIIHGYGSSGKGGITKEIARNWAFRNREKFRSVIAGESFDILDPIIQEMRKELGEFVDSDLGKQNPGITLIWVK